MASLPYITSPGSIDKALTGIKSAAVPDRVSQDFVKTILKIRGGSGDQVTSFLKKLGLANNDGSPNEVYKRFRNPASSGAAIASAIKTAYAPLYVRNEFMHELSMSRIEQQFNVELGHDVAAPKGRKATEYEQFEAALRLEAARMSEFYEVFYCLENSIRKLVEDIMIEAEGADWWNSVRVDEDKIRKPAVSRNKKEIDSGITPRSERLIDYTTFGELSQLITDNWELFDPIFQSKTAVSNVSNQLNLLRGPIAHCNPTDELEQERLNLAVRTWFKIMS